MSSVSRAAASKTATLAPRAPATTAVARAAGRNSAAANAPAPTTDPGKAAAFAPPQLVCKKSRGASSSTSSEVDPARSTPNADAHAPAGNTTFPGLASTSLATRATAARASSDHARAKGTTPNPSRTKRVSETAFAAFAAFAFFDGFGGLPPFVFAGFPPPREMSAS